MSQIYKDFGKQKSKSTLFRLALILFLLLIAVLAAGRLRIRSAEAALPEVPAPQIHTVAQQAERDEQASASASLGGIGVQASNFRLEGKSLLADLCYDRPSEADWLLGVPVLELAGRGISAFSVSLVEYRDGPTSSGQRCDTVSFPIEGGADLASFRIVVPRLEISWPDRLDCAAAQRELDSTNSGIAIQCVTEEGYSGYEVVQRPESLSEEAIAAQILAAFQKSIGLWEGPWALEGSLP